MSLFLGLLLGCALLLMWQGIQRPVATVGHRASILRFRLDQAGFQDVGTLRAVVCALLGSAAAGMLAWLMTRTVPVALAVTGVALALPWWWLGARRTARLRARRNTWPEVLDHLRSAVRAGVPLSEAIAQLATQGPAELRSAFSGYAADLRVARRADEALERLRLRLMDPVADRIIAAVLLTREVGGADVGHMLGTLSSFLRAELRTRGELEARQSWTVNGARLAVAAPWVILLVLCLEPRIAAAYSTPAGAAVLGVGAVVALVSYRLMLKLAALENADEAPSALSAGQDSDDAAEGSRA